MGKRDQAEPDVRAADFAFFVPWGIATGATIPALAVAVVAYVLKIVVLVVALAALESAVAKMRMYLVPEFLHPFALFRQEAFIRHGFAPACGFQFGDVKIAVVIGEIDAFRAVLEKIVRQPVTSVVEGEFAAALNDVFQGDPGGGEKHRILDRHDRGILVDPMAVASLEQKLLAGDRPGVKHQGQEPGDTRVEANLPRRGQVDVQVEQAFEPVRRAAGQLAFGIVIAVVGGQKLARVQVMAANIVCEPVDQTGLDRAAPQQPAVLDEMLEVIAFRRGDFAGVVRVRRPAASHRACRSTASSYSAHFPAPPT